MFSSAVSRLTLTFALVVLFSHFARAAPAGFDYATLLKNGQEAQRLNAEYMTLSANDTCTELQKGCVNDMPAQCIGGKWSLATTGCPDSQHCFALPSVRQSGTFVACTSEADAFSIIAATGAEGGIIGDSGDNNNTSQGETSSTSSATGPSRSSSATASRNPASTSAAAAATAAVPTGSSSAPSPSSATSAASASSAPGPVVVTKTMTLAPGSTMTLSPTTITLAQASASAVLSSLIANGASIISVIHSTPSPSTSA